MRDDQRYVVDSLRTTGIGLLVSGIIGLIFGKTSAGACLTAIACGIALVVLGYYYVRRR